MAGLPQLPGGLRAVRRLGESPLSQVFLVLDEDGRRFALKVLRASVAQDQRIRERWRREAELLEELAHPNLVRSHGALEVDGRPALLLEYVEGQTLRAALTDGPLGWEQVARYGVQVSRALDRLHRHGAVHRDVKPHNVLLDPRRGAVLADLGLVRREEDPTLTRQGAALGSPAYMSPEQARDPSDVDEQADIYSLGATLHHAVSGQPPFLGSGVGEVIHRVLHEDPEALPDVVPEALARVLATAMAKDRERRYVRARDLGADLGRVLLGYPPRLWTRHVRRRRARLASAAGVAGVLTAGILLWQPWGPGEDDLPDGGAGAAVAEAPDGGARSGGATPSGGDGAGTAVQPRDSAAWFGSWVAPYADRFAAALRRDRYREALAEVDAVRRLGVPPDAPAGFLEARREWTRDAEQQVAAAAERTAGAALDVLAAEARAARTMVERGLFDGSTWSVEVRRLWRDAGLVVDDLPLHAGGADPTGRLQLTRAMLERDADRARVRLAVGEVGDVRRDTARLLRGGHFDEARDRWMDADPVVFEHSAEARSDLARIDELVALERRLQARFRERARGEVSLRLANGGLLRGALVPQGAGGFAIDYLGQEEVPVRLLMLDADFVIEWLQGGEQPWLAAQLRWSQGAPTDALRRMEALDPDALPEEWNPSMWIAEWRREVARGSDESAVVSDDLPVAPIAPVPPVADSGLETRLQEAFPGATWSLVDGLLRGEFSDVAFAPDWELDLRRELRGWEPIAWEMSWSLPLGATPPRRLQWLGDIVFERAGPRGLPQVRIGGVRHAGYGVLAGQGTQALAWRDGQLELDGVPMGRWSPDSPRLQLRGEADPSFRATRIVIELERPR